MDKQVNDTTQEQENKRFANFLDRLTIPQRIPKWPIRIWLAWAGVILFIGLVIAYYVLNGG